MAYLLHHLLIESARIYPDKEAVRFEGQALTYAQLDKMTNQVARMLWRLVCGGAIVWGFMSTNRGFRNQRFWNYESRGCIRAARSKCAAKRLAYITRNCDIQALLTSTEQLNSLAQFLG